MSSPVSDDPFLDLLPASRLTPCAVEWLWPAHLPLGELSLLDGDPGLGKSLLTLDLCARLSTGRPFPDGQAGPGPASAIVLNGEDAAESTIVPRLQALGADLGRVHVLHRTGGGAREPLRFPAHAEHLGRAVARTGARLVVLDPVLAFFGRHVCTSNDRSVRQALEPLVSVAREHRCAVHLVRHLNKSGGARALYRGLESIALVAVCRAAWLVGRDPHDPDRCVLAQVKKNLAAGQPSLAYTVSDPGGPAPTLTWLGPSPWTADQLVAAASAAPPPPPARERARAFLEGALRDGPRTSRDLWALARRERLSKRTLRRAKEDLGLRSVRAWVEGKCLSYWLRSGQALPGGVPPGHDTSAVDEALARLNEQYPPATPLDDL